MARIAYYRELLKNDLSGRLTQVGDCLSPEDILATTLCAPLADYMPGVRQAVVWNLPRRRLALREHWRLAARLRRRSAPTVK